MYTIFGIKWPVPTAFEVGVIVFVFFSIVFILLVLYNKLVVQNRKAYSFNLFLFKVRRLGLSSFKIKILRTFIESMMLKNPVILLKKPKLFESAITRFHIFLQKQGESPESINSIYREIISIYERLYHRVPYRKKLSSVKNIDKGQMVSISLKDKYTFIGKVISVDQFIKTGLLVRKSDMRKIKKNSVAEVVFFRSGDAEYKFNSAIKYIEKRMIYFAIPDKTTRLDIVRLPEVPVDIECTLTLVKELASSDKQKAMNVNQVFKGLILRLSIDGIGVSLKKKIDYNEKYLVDFRLMDFNIKTKCSVLSEKKIRVTDNRCYTLRIEDISDRAKDVLSKYIASRY